MYTPPFTVSSKAINLIAEISAQIERYSIRMEQSDSLRLRKMTGRRQWAFRSYSLCFRAIIRLQRLFLRDALLHQSEVPVAFDFEGIDGEGGGKELGLILGMAEGDTELDDIVIWIREGVALKLSLP